MAAVTAWTFIAPGQAMELVARRETPRAGEVLVQVAGCGICHTDLGFYYDGIATRAPLPLTLGHEISGQVIEVGEGAEPWLGKAVVVPAVLPCGACAACRSGRGSICPDQVFPGNDVHGGFATHVRVPARGLCAVPDLAGVGVDLASLSVVADAVTTPFQAIHRSGMRAGDLAVVVGVGGVGGFAVQIASALAAQVIAIDVQDERLADAVKGGAALALNARTLAAKSLREAVRAFARDQGIATFRWFLFECSGTAAGQQTAYQLLDKGGYLSVVGFTKDKLELRLSNLMAFDATVQGNWGCLPEHYPAALQLVLDGKVQLGNAVELRPMAQIQDCFAQVHAGGVKKRIVLVPNH